MKRSNSHPNVLVVEAGTLVFEARTFAQGHRALLGVGRRTLARHLPHHLVHHRAGLCARAECKTSRPFLSLS